MNIEKVEWDSDFFGYKVGKINVKDELNYNIDLINFDDYKLVYLFSKFKLQNFDSILLDEKVILNLNLIDQR